MLRASILMASMLAGLVSFGAQAAVPSYDMRENDMRGHSLSEQASPAIRLAQYGDVEVYFDEYGNRIVRDTYTGEIIAVERPRQQERRDTRRGGEQERYYLDDPQDMERLRQRKLRDGDYDPGYPTGREYGGYDRQPYPRGGIEQFPEAPQQAFPDEWEQDTARGAPADTRIERRPLDVSPAQPGISQPGSPATGEASIPPYDPSDIIGDDGASIAAVPPSAGETPQASAPALPGGSEGAIDSSLRLGAREDIAALQVLLDRRGASPGVIDGRFGSNVDKAIVAYRSITGQNLRSTDAEAIRNALAETGGDPFIEYTITASDAAGPFVASVPSDYGEKAKLEHMSYTSVSEMLAERFHMDEAYLKALNPQANFGRVGTIIRVANTGKAVTGQVARIVADKGKKQVFAYDANNRLLAAYPATIGSSSTPSPTGTHLVSRVALDPNYTYNPNLNFKQGENDKVLTIPPGPNGPVGNVWIALDKPTYGIHGTPDPSKIGKTESHGCVRLTNWDAQELAKIVKPGVPVEFVE